MAPEWPAPKAIQHWPGKLGHENRNKVDTAVAYDMKTGYPTTWGFLIDDEDPNLDARDLFKLYLDPNHEDGSPGKPTVQEARKWFTDYLHFIYQAIVQHFDESYPRWSSRMVEFLFSVPTTWKSPGMVAEMENLIKQAGFAERPNYVARIALTEAEAAAVYTSKQSYESGDVFLVCDAGGGTTDVNVLKVTNAAFGHTTLEPLSWVEGKAVGSSLIDFKMERMIVERLQRIKHNLPSEPEDLAQRMMSDRFETFKCSFGAEAFSALDLLLPVPGLPGGLDFPQSRVRDSKLVITR